MTCVECRKKLELDPDRECTRAERATVLSHLLECGSCYDYSKTNGFAGPLAKQEDIDADVADPEFCAVAFAKLMPNR